MYVYINNINIITYIVSIALSPSLSLQSFPPSTLYLLFLHLHLFHLLLVLFLFLLILILILFLFR